MDDGFEEEFDEKFKFDFPEGSYGEAVRGLHEAVREFVEAVRELTVGHPAVRRIEERVEQVLSRDRGT